MAIRSLVAGTMRKENNHGELPPLTKKEKGRLKKLRRRSLEVKEGCETSGLTSNQDWLEWKGLQRNSKEQQVVGPSVRLRKGIPDEQSSSVSNWPRCEGVDHLHVLCRFLFEYMATENTKKRKLSSCNIPQSVPSWATLHNPASTDCVAIVQIQLEGNFSPWENVLEQLDSLCNLLPRDKSASTSGRTALPMRTRWFQGNYPRSLSDSLLYLPSEDRGSKKKKTNDENACTESTASLLSSLVLTAEQRGKEGYPILSPDNEESPETRREAEAKISLASQEGRTAFSLAEAINLVNKLKVPVVDDMLGDDATSSTEATTIGDHYVRTLPLPMGDSAPRVFGLDCEMVKTSAGPELARMTLVRLDENEAGRDNDKYTLVLDELVKPNRPVLDYLTNYSGMTAKGMEHVCTRLQQVQVAFLCHVREDDIVIGHSLENDLQALRVVHDNVVDTSVLFRSSSGRKYSLRHLSAALLGKTIQTDATTGHCSEEDATAALNLAIRRARLGPSFRIAERRDGHIPLLYALQQQNRNKTMVCVGPTDWLRAHVTSHSGHSAHALTCETVHHPNTKAIPAWLTSETRKASLVWANFVVDNESVSDMKKLNENLSVLIERMLPGTVLLVALQQGHARALEHSKRRKACRDPRSTAGWSISQEEEWQRTVDQSRSGVAFWIGTE